MEFAAQNFMSGPGDDGMNARPKCFPRFDILVFADPLCEPIFDILTQMQSQRSKKPTRRAPFHAYYTLMDQVNKVREDYPVATPLAKKKSA
jgi:hypothetical protein